LDLSFMKKVVHCIDIYDNIVYNIDTIK